MFPSTRSKIAPVEGTRAFVLNVANYETAAMRSIMFEKPEPKEDHEHTEMAAQAKC